MTARLAAVEEASALWVESPPVSCSCTSSCYTEDVEVEEEDDDDDDGDANFMHKTDSLKSNLVCGDESSPCVCTSSCFEDEEDGAKKEQAEVYPASYANETELCSLVTDEEEVEANTETIVSLQDTRQETGKGNVNDKKRKFGKFRAMAAMLAVFCVAVAGIVFQNFFSEGQPVYLVPT
ncbi:hypothetical protein HPP92_005325 [Vanilla planifolia]|uniref:Transmembrane protein n=1 Tax=Vanilla planifolia TaxID=51239 RepID=A0A835RU80_VANPL|nr:hypothetical protein HPP92_005325 [Vanilla planifolia]